MNQRAEERFVETNQRVEEQFVETNRRAEERHEFLLRQWHKSMALERARHQELIGRGKASERVFISAFDEIVARLERSDQRADAASREHVDAIRDMRASIRANTEAVLSVLDRLGPATS